jgi:hypothetical protein
MKEMVKFITEEIYYSRIKVERNGEKGRNSSCSLCKKWELRLQGVIL